MLDILRFLRESGLSPNAFYVSMLRKCVSDLDQIVELQPLQIKNDLSYAEHSIKILNVQEKQLRNRTQTFRKI